MSTPPDLHRIASYVMGSGTPEARAETAAWIDASEERRDVAAAFARIFRAGPHGIPASDEFAARARLRATLGDEGAARATDIHHLTRRPVPPAAAFARQLHAPWRAARASRTWRWSVSAALLLLAVMMTRLVMDRRAAPIRSASRVYTAGIGERVSMTLTDGTQIELAPASRLRVPSTYGDTTRTVMLDGEAFFRVSHDARRPFVVGAVNAVAADVGTSFDVRAYSDEATVSVAVNDGRVSLSVRGDDHRHALGPHDVGAVDRSGATRVTHNDDSAPFTAWAAGDLVYRDTPASIVLTDLRRWYGIDVQVEDANLSGRRLTVRFDHGESIDQVGDVLRGLLGSQVVLRPAPDTAPATIEGH